MSCVVFLFDETHHSGSIINIDMDVNTFDFAEKAGNTLILKHYADLVNVSGDKDELAEWFKRVS